MSSKIKYTKWPQTEIERLTVKSTPYTLNTYPIGCILVCFAVRIAISETQGRQKSKCTKWPQTELEN